eukprot:CAMPEP_0202956488 /NCGR_PEP_ID=MMETSP1396-20130829/993_1 /ASSEMBLY_ACC=CAM_ASM_000872 /TAXON_ID= /ORGANISM="Pseudokeronopsis sp., Strain Brazil" /LENGTH=477 /DNA_ID=CAMNT_0049673519 /DNA_START=6 /DNA_END=1439 /DNA_ORIENTATION=-
MNESETGSFKKNSFLAVSEEEDEGQSRKSKSKMSLVAKRVTFQPRESEKLLASDLVLSEDDPNKKQMQKMNKKRFGFNVSLDRYKTSSLLKIICIIVAIIIIPLEIFLESVLQSVENKLILQVQETFPFPTSDGENHGWEVFWKIPIYLAMENVCCLYMCFLFLCTDSLIAFKSALLTCFGFYFITFLKLVYKDGRPFWLSAEVQGLLCEFDYGGPSYHLYVMCFFWVYNLIMYRMKYAYEVNKCVNSLCVVLISVLSAWIVLAGMYCGVSYIYQNIIGMLYGLIYLVLCLNFDKEIHKMCEKTGFIVQTSRKYKFYLFFLCIGLFIFIMIYYNSNLKYWTMPQSWVVNVSLDQQQCRDELIENSNDKLGLDATFFDSSILFFLTGLGFGISFSLVYVDCLDWVHTKPHLRLIRALLGCGIAGGVYYGFQQIPAEDSPTKYFFHYVLPALLVSFFIYGLYPILCLKIGLVSVSKEVK